MNCSSQPPRLRAGCVRVSGSCGCPAKAPQTGGFTGQKCTLSPPWSPKVRYPGVGRATPVCWLRGAAVPASLREAEVFLDLQLRHAALRPSLSSSHPPLAPVSRVPLPVIFVGHLGSGPVTQEQRLLFPFLTLTTSLAA